MKNKEMNYQEAWSTLADLLSVRDETIAGLLDKLTAITEICDHSRSVNIHAKDCNCTACQIMRKINK